MNEIFALHATTTEFSELISELGFDVRHVVDFSSKNCPFGFASYFSTLSSAAFQYISNSRMTNGVFNMMIARVCLGDVHFCFKYDEAKYKGQHRAPSKYGSLELYDSVMAVKQEEVEIAIYNRDQIYCEYVVECSVENL